MKYFEVQVELIHDNGTAKPKKIKETYLVDAESVTEAEARLVKDFEGKGVGIEFAVKSAKESRVIGVIS